MTGIPSPSLYPAIGDHGLIGDLRTCALVADDGSVAWYCPGRFDGPSVFASILDAERGGAFRVWVDRARSAQLYVPDTAVLVTRFTAPGGGVGEVVDFMVPRARALRPSPYPAGRPRHGRLRDVLPPPLRLRTRGRDGAARRRRPGDVRRTGRHADPGGVGAAGRGRRRAHASAVLRAGEQAAFCLTDAPDAAYAAGTAGRPAGRRLGLPAGAALVDFVQAELDATLAFWRAWIRQSTYRGRWTEAVHRSAVTLKLLTHAPSGGIVAAATTALPEEPGGERNWDYRYTWVRDGVAVGARLAPPRVPQEAEEFARWIGARITEGPTPSGEPLAIMYRVDGATDLVEEELPHLAGHADSRPVRIGNGAADQLQLDIYGEVLYSLADTEYFRSPEGRARIVAILDWLVDHWDRADEGVWETRAAGGPSPTAG